ncbi:MULTISPECIES: response regulator transcription factor [Cohnella]|uniref:LuxR family two component transcriptional regulator n=1 Tax=Cohnella phaseoli TaxID=456490 RepID=A0A3D9JU15_9BACL|nr:response regulator transcription factor [Cohnella phaseoli]RED77562.1 LuxR family two component transcriptional regulator [Cohnella phaseoli]
MDGAAEISVMLVDDQKILLEGLETLISLRSNIKIVGTAQSGEEALERLREVVPDVILMDIRMPGMGGVKATEAILERYPHVIILILTTFDDDAYIIEALSNGASGYLLKDIDGEKLVQAIHEALSGNLLLTGKVANKLALNIRKQNKRLGQLGEELEFSTRELDLARLLVRGHNAKEMAEKLFLTQGTVKNYLSDIYAKIGTNDRAKAVLILERYLSASDGK